MTGTAQGRTGPAPSALFASQAAHSPFIMLNYASVSMECNVQAPAGRWGKPRPSTPQGLTCEQRKLSTQDQKQSKEHALLPELLVGPHPLRMSHSSP